MHNINGVYSAALTPINENLSINKKLYLEHCQYLMKQGHDGLAIFGTTGEANSFSIKEKCDTIDFLLSNNIDPQLLIPGTGSSSVEDAIQLTKFAEKHKTRAVLLQPPFYYKNVSDEGILNYFRKIIESVGSSDFHYLLYNIPQTTSVELNFNIIETLLKLYPNNIVGIKDSSGNTDSMLKTVKYFENLALFCGHDSLALHICKRGGAGAITAGTNISGKLLSFIINNKNKEKEIKGFNNYQTLLEQIRETITSEEPISVMKAYFSVINDIPEWNNLMPPLKSLDQPSKNKTIIRLIELTTKMNELISSA
tara:strand:+ start:4488 stop:5417 length:930 start_codon:yes stop_codon:yes gene_type:complete